MHSPVEAHNEVAEIFQAEIYSTDCLHCPAQAGLLVHKTQSGNTDTSSLGRYVFGSEISYNKAPPRLPGLGC